MKIEDFRVNLRSNFLKKHPVHTINCEFSTFILFDQYENIWEFHNAEREDWQKQKQEEIK